MDIGKIVNSQVAEMLKSGDIETQIAEAVSSSIKKVINEKFTSYQFRNALEKKFNEEVDPVIEDVSFAGYGAIVKGRLTDILKSVADKDVSDEVEKTYNEIFTPTNKPLDLADFFSRYRESLMEDNNEYGNHFGFNLTESDDGNFNRVTIKFADEEGDLDSDYFATEFKLMRYKEGNYTVSSLKCKGIYVSSINKSLTNVSGIDSYQRELLRAVLCDQKVDMNIDDDVDTSKYDD